MPRRSAQTDKLAILGGKPVIPKVTWKNWPPITAADKRAVLKVMDREVFWGNRVEVPKFNAEWSAYVGLPHTIMTNSGTAALHMAVAAAGIGPGDEVVTTPFTWTSSATCILHHNAVPVFADIDPTTYTVAPAEMAKKITRRTKALLPVHLHGTPADMDPIMSLARKHGLMVIEDCCQAHGSRYKGRQVGTMGHIAAFSLNGNKMLPGGEGGMASTSDPKLHTEALRVHQFGETHDPKGRRDYNAATMGWMYRTTELNAAFARTQLKRFPRYLAKTRENAHFLTRQLAGIKGLRLPSEPKGNAQNFYAYPMKFVAAEAGIDVPNRVFRDKVRDALSAEGAPLGSVPARNLPGMTLFQDRSGYGKGCPWTCPFGSAKAVTYRVADYPNMVDAIDSLASIGQQLRPPHGKREMRLIAAAFHKVFAQLDAVMGA